MDAVIEKDSSLLLGMTKDNNFRMTNASETEDKEKFDIKRISDIDYIKKKYIQTGDVNRMFVKGLYEITFLTNLTREEVKSFCGIFGYDVLDVRVFEERATVTVKVNEEDER